MKLNVERGREGLKEAESGSRGGERAKATVLGRIKMQYNKLGGSQYIAVYSGTSE